MKRRSGIYATSFIILCGIFVITQIFDLLIIIGILGLVYESILSVILFLSHYVLSMVRFCWFYLIIYFLLCLFNVPMAAGYNYKLKFFGIDLDLYKPQFNYLFFYIKEYNYFLLLIFNLAFFLFVFYYGLFYNIFVIGIFLLFYLFLGLNIWIKYIIKKYEYTNKNVLHFCINIILSIIFALYISLIGDAIFKEINLKIDLTEYILEAMHRKDRFFLKFQDNPNYFRILSLYKGEKFSANYLYIKNILLKNNILGQISYNNLKYINFSGKNISNNYILTNKENLENFQIENISLETLNSNCNNIYIDNNYVWYNTNFQNKDLEQYNEVTKANISKYNNNLNWFTYVLNVYNLNWSHFMPSLRELNNVAPLLKSEKYSNYDFIDNLLLSKNDVKWLNEQMLDNYNDYTLLKNKIINSKTYNFNLYDLLKYKYIYNKNSFDFIEELFLVNNKNFIIGDNELLNLKYQNLNELRNKIINFKNELLELLDNDNLNVILYKYSYLLNWWEKNFFIIHNMYNDSVYKQKYAEFTKYLVTEKSLLTLQNNNDTSFSKNAIKAMVKELNTDHWLEGFLSPLDLLKKSTILKFIDRNYFYFNIYKDFLYPNFHFKEDWDYYYDYLFRELGLFKINNVIYVILTFEKPYNWFEYLFKEYLKFFKDIGIYEKDNFFWKYHRPANKYFYYFLDYNNKLSLVSNNILYYVLEDTYLKNMDITKTYNEKLLEFNNSKWSLYFDLIGFRYSKFIEWCYDIYAYDLNYKHYNKDVSDFKQSFLNKDKNCDCKKTTLFNQPSNVSWFDKLQFWLHLYPLDKFDSIKDYIIIVANNAYPENKKFKEYLLSDGVADILAIYWADQFYRGAPLSEFINMFKTLNHDLLSYESKSKNNLSEYFKKYQFKDMKNKYLNKSDYWKDYSYYSQFGTKEELIVAEKLTMVHNRMTVAELAFDTYWCMSLSPEDYEVNFEKLVFENFYERWAAEFIERHYYWRITHVVKEFLHDMEKNYKIWSNNLLDVYFTKERDMHDIRDIRKEYEADINRLVELRELFFDVTEAQLSMLKDELDPYEFIQVLVAIDPNADFDSDILYLRNLEWYAYYTYKRDACIWKILRLEEDADRLMEVIEELVGVEEDEIPDEMELDIRMKSRSLIAWKEHKDILRAERWRKEYKEIEDSDFLMSLEKNLINKDWNKYNKQRYHNEIPTFARKPYFMKTKK